MKGWACRKKSIALTHQGQFAYRRKGQLLTDGSFPLLRLLCRCWRTWWLLESGSCCRTVTFWWSGLSVWKRPWRTLQSLTRTFGSGSPLTRQRASPLESCRSPWRYRAAGKPGSEGHVLLLFYSKTGWLWEEHDQNVQRVDLGCMS